MVNENHTPVDVKMNDAAEDTSVEINGNNINGNTPSEDSSNTAGDAQVGKIKTVQVLVEKVKNDTHLSTTSKMDTLALLITRFVEENSELQHEAKMVNDQMEKHKEAKDAMKALNVFLKKQIDLVKQESELRLEEEQSRGDDCKGGYQNTMSELSGLLEKHQEKNSSLNDQNGEMADQMLLLVKETEKREGQIEKMQAEFQLQVKLLEHQVAKAQIEKAEVKADMAKERIDVLQDLNVERDRNLKLEETVELLKKQADIYQKQMLELEKGAGDSTGSFEYFKTQIGKLTEQMVTLEKESAQWKEKSDTSSGQVAKMSLATMEKEKEMILIKSKLESMIKLNKTLTAERTELLGKLKN